MKRLKYIKWIEGDKFYGRALREDAQTHRWYNFSPFAEVPDDFAVRLMKAQPNDFAIVSEVAGAQPPPPPAAFVCADCGFTAKTNRALLTHRRMKHKEEKNEETV